MPCLTRRATSDNRVFYFMNTIKSILGESTITPDYDDLTNTVEISIGNKDGFRFVHLDEERTDYLIDLLIEYKNMITNG